ncbi:hypothetical protein [Microbacterium suwonense]|uniref:FHA domain-containing protein n=1 Tax=Microbacterium suwonense TaxID=683047 RepID=A0ABN6X4G8_9MICO|nr:hypothetical protein [Microbacterium suwonense]BDZ39592.1 hypothetical protein GCM10025863_22060 [Microbacterium suwonense]
MPEIQKQGTPEPAQSTALLLEFGAQRELIPAGTSFVIGRGADLSIDDNPYVHRRFLEIAERDGIWWLANVGSGLTASVASADGLAQSWLAPGASMPLVFGATTVMFTAGETTYEFSLTADTPYYQVSASWSRAAGADGVAELLSPMQRILLTALAEPMLRHGDGGSVQLPALDEVAARLGWSIEKLGRRVDSLCGKFARHGIRGLERRPDGEILASSRSRLVEHAIGARIVTTEDLPLLDAFVAQDDIAAVASSR